MNRSYPSMHGLMIFCAREEGRSALASQHSFWLLDRLRQNPALRNLLSISFSSSAISWLWEITGQVVPSMVRPLSCSLRSSSSSQKATSLGFQPMGLALRCFLRRLRRSSARRSSSAGSFSATTKRRFSRPQGQQQQSATQPAAVAPAASASAARRVAGSLATRGHRRRSSEGKPRFAGDAEGEETLPLRRTRFPTIALLSQVNSRWKTCDRRERSKLQGARFFKCGSERASCRWMREDFKEREVQAERAKCVI